MANPRGQQRDKPFRDALRMAISESGTDFKRLRTIASKLVSTAEAGDIAAIREVADRLDGKPAQESMVTIDKRDSTDWTRDELVGFLNDAKAGSERASKTNGSGIEPDSVH